MTGRSPDRDEELIFAYIDGELDADDAADLDRRLMREPALRRRLEALRAINTGLGRIASYTGGERTEAPRRRTSRLAGVWAAAAVLVLGAGSLIYRASLPSAPAFTPKAHNASIDAAAQYARITHAFEPHVVCDTPKKFESYTRSAFGTAIDADFGAGVTLIGWCALAGDYTEPGEGGTSTRVLLAETHGGARTITFFVPPDHAAPDLNGKEGSDATLVMHEARLGPVRVYEVTPESEPSVIPVLSVP